mmetsp:Transcript_20653/g.52280  ORF Transcript_20653/g.52280 Transcript_20653/m.52280 type:complete len:315 (-) Transcript_20653:31-975(-)
MVSISATRDCASSIFSSFSSSWSVSSSTLSLSSSTCASSSISRSARDSCSFTPERLMTTVLPASAADGCGGGRAACFSSVFFSDSSAAMRDLSCDTSSALESSADLILVCASSFIFSTRLVRSSMSSVTLSLSFWIFIAALRLNVFIFSSMSFFSSSIISSLLFSASILTSSGGPLSTDASLDFDDRRERSVGVREWRSRVGVVRGALRALSLWSLSFSLSLCSLWCSLPSRGSTGGGTPLWLPILLSSFFSSFSLLSSFFLFSSLFSFSSSFSSFSSSFPSFFSSFCPFSFSTSLLLDACTSFCCFSGSAAFS